MKNAEKIKKKVNTPEEREEKKNEILWFIALFAAFELTFIVQNISENNIIYVEKDFFIPDATIIFYLTLFSLFLFVIILFVLKNHINLIIGICTFFGIIASCLMFISNLTIYTIGFYINSCISTLLSFLTFIYICTNFSIKSAILEAILGTFLYKLPLQFLNISKFNIPFDISVSLMICAYVIFMAVFITLNLRAPNKSIPLVKELKNEETDEISSVAKVVKEPPYFIYILVAVICLLLAIIQSLSSSFILTTENLKIWSNVFFMLSLAICFILVLYKNHTAFFEYTSLLPYIYIVGLILMFFNNNITQIIGASIIGFCSPVYLIYLPLALIMYNKTGKSSTPFWLICLNFIGLQAFNKILNKITGLNGYITMIIIICIALIVVLYFAKPYIRFASISKKISYDKKNDKENPYSYLSDVELKFVNLIVDGYTFNQITGILNITPVQLKEIKLCVYHLLNVKNKQELVENAYKLNNKNI